MNTSTEITDKMSWSEEKLLQDLGSTSGLLMAQEDPRIRGASLLGSLLLKLRPLLCGNSVIRGHFDPDKPIEEQVTLACAICDLLSGLLTGVSPTTVTVLVLRQGLGRICEPIWSDEN